MQDSIGIPACFSSASDDHHHHHGVVTHSGKTVYMSVYRTKSAGHSCLITITWCKNLMLHGLSVAVENPEKETQYICKVELKPWYFWRKHGSKRFTIDGKAVEVFWDLKSAKFNGETEPTSEYYVAVVCDQEVVLLASQWRAIVSLIHYHHQSISCCYKMLHSEFPPYIHQFLKTNHYFNVPQSV